MSVDSRFIPAATYDIRYPVSRTNVTVPDGYVLVPVDEYERLKRIEASRLKMFTGKVESK